MAIFDVLAEGQTPRNYRAGQIIYLQGTHPDCFYYLLSGSVRSFISTQAGEERVLTVHRPGDLMGEASFFDKCPRVTSAMALSDSRVILVTQERLSAIFSRHPDLALPMLQYLARTVRMLSTHVGISSLPAEQRIVRYLLAQFSGNQGTLPCTHEEIGQAVGVSRITVSRILGVFARQGIVRTGYGSLELLDAAALKLRSEP